MTLGAVAGKGRTPAEILAQGYDAFNRRDTGLLRELLTEDFSWNEAEGVPGRRDCSSAEEFISYCLGFDLLWESFAFEPLAMTPAPSGAVVASVRGEGRGRASGQAAVLEIHHVWRFRDGRAARMDAFLDPADAADAAAR